ncbi:MAG: O-antigen ligase family protein [Anaerolineae bacterium]|nr:O-antigen ligase family protein [Anaerolineae bacterium]
MNQRRIALLISILLCLAAASGAAAVLHARAEYTRGWADAAYDAALPARVPPAGVNAELMQYPPGELDAHLQMMKDAGVVWVRQVFPWTLAPEADWAAWDRIVRAVEAHGLRLLAVLDGAAQCPAGAVCRPPAGPVDAAGLGYPPPADVEDFAAFAGKFAARYGTAVNVYQVWDEPNLKTHWGGMPQPAEYGALLCAAYRAIHAADPSPTDSAAAEDKTLVLAAALAPNYETGPDYLSDTMFLRGLYGHGARDCFDGAAGKPYGFDAGPYDRRVDEKLLNFARLILLREIMVEHGDGHKPLWACAFGWNHLPDGWTGGPSVWGAVDAETQAQHVRDAYARARAEWPWLGGLILYHWQPAVPADDPLWGFAVVGPDGAPARLRDAFPDEPPAAAAGRYLADNPHVEYTGEWSFTEFGADMGAGVGEGNGFVFRFVGPELALELRRFRYNAYFYATVDGQPANALPRDPDGRAYIVLNSADDQQHTTDLIMVARGLDPGAVHTLTVTGQASWGGQWALGGFRVGAAPDVQGYDLALAGLVAVGLVALAGGGALHKEWFGLLHLSRAAAWLRSTPLAHLAASAVTSLLLFAGLVMTWGGALPNVARRAGEAPTLAAIALTAGLLYFSPAFIVTAACVLVLFFLIYQRVLYGLALVVFWAPFYLVPVELIIGRRFSMVEITLLITFAAWALRGLVEWAAGRGASAPLRARLARLRLADWVWIGLAATGALGVTWASFHAEALRELRVVLVEPALFYLVLRAAVTSAHDADADATRPAAPWLLLDALLASGVVVAVIGFYHFARGTHVIVAEAGTHRLASVYGSPNSAALFLGACVGIVLGVLFSPRRHGEHGEDERKEDGKRVSLFAALAASLRFVVSGSRRRAAYALAGVIVLGAGVLTQSMGFILLGFPAALAMTLLLGYGRRAVPLLVGLAVVAVIAFIPLTRLSPRAANLFNFTSGTSFIRILVWQGTLNMIAEHPILGVGPDQFLYQYRSRYILPAGWTEPDLSHAHNYFLDHWARLGIVGLALAVAMQVAFWRAAYRTWRRGGARRALAAGLMGAMAYFMAHGLVDTPFFVVDLNYTYALLTALALAPAGAAQDNPPGQSAESL